jgi:hypothetical protein
MWSAVGAVLSVVGVHWLLAAGWLMLVVLLAAAAVAGVLKARYVLLRTADKTVERIRTRGDGRCLGGFLSVRSWMFVASMMALGWVLRTSSTPRIVLGCIYVAVGVALIAASFRLWRACSRFQPAVPPEPVPDDNLAPDA